MFPYILYLIYRTLFKFFLMSELLIFSWAFPWHSLLEYKSVLQTLMNLFSQQWLPLTSVTVANIQHFYKSDPRVSSQATRKWEHAIADYLWKPTMCGYFSDGSRRCFLTADYWWDWGFFGCITGSSVEHTLFTPILSLDLSPIFSFPCSRLFAFWDNVFSP